MKINKRFLTLLGMGFVAIGLMLSFLGFALSGFSPRAYAQEKTHWYHTVHFSDNRHSDEAEHFLDRVGIFFERFE